MYLIWSIPNWNIQIVRNLSRAVDVDARLARLEERSRHVQINEDSCHASLGTKVFAMYPDDTIVCYKVRDMDLPCIIWMRMNVWNSMGHCISGFFEL